MARRRLVFGFCLVLVALTASLTLWRSKGSVIPPLARVLGKDLPVQSLDFTYSSSSYLNPAIPGSQHAGGGITITCSAKGLMHAAEPTSGSLSFVFELREFLCGDSDVIQERGLIRTAQFTREFLISNAALQRATQDPLLAIARTIFFHFDVGLRPSWPTNETVGINRELRLEGEILPELRWTRGPQDVQWTKTFAGTVNNHPLAHQIHYDVTATSRPMQPVDLGLLELKGTERSISLQNKHLVARNDIQVRLHRVDAISSLRLRELLAEAKADAPAAAPKILSTEERQEIVRRWRHFRDDEGQRPSAGESEANQPEYLELKQALRQEPALVEELAVDLKEMEPTSSGFATLAGALVYSGEGAALDAFVEQAEAHKGNPSWENRAVPLIGLAPVPTEKSWKYLDELRQKAKDPELKTAAELGMSTHVKRGYQEPAFIDEIGQRLAAAQTEEERLHLLDLIGNAGLDQFFPTITAWIPGASLTLRLRIAQALRFMREPKAEDLLLQMAADPQLELSLTALQCLRDRTVRAASIPVLLQQLAGAQDDRVRLKVLENLYEARHLDAGLLTKIHSLRERSSLSPALAEAWEQIEKDWADPVES